jgi:pyrimidine-nucleoside phosphorylase
MVSGALASGAALARFRDMVALQGGDTAVIDDTAKLPSARTRTDVTAPRDGVIVTIDADFVGRASMLLGAGRDTVGQDIDHAAGIVLRAKPGDAVAAGAPVATLHYNDDSRLADAVTLVQSAIHIASAAPPPLPLVLAWVRHDEETLFA